MDDFKIIKLPPERWQEYKDLKLESLTLEPTAFASTPEEKNNDTEEDWKNDLKGVLYFVEMNEKLIGLAGAYKENHIKSSHIFDCFLENAIISTYG